MTKKKIKAQKKEKERKKRSKKKGKKKQEKVSREKPLFAFYSKKAQPHIQEALVTSTGVM